MATHLDEAMSVLSPADRHLAANIFHYLVTPSGTKIAHAPLDLAAYVESSEETIRRVLQRLSESDVRILRPVPRPLGQEGESRFEIFHDVLAHVILDWRTRYLKDRERSDAVKWGAATVVHGLAGFWWLLITFGVVLIAIDEDPVELVLLHLDAAGDGRLDCRDTGASSALAGAKAIAACASARGDRRVHGAAQPSRDRPGRADQAAAAAAAAKPQSRHRRFTS